MAARRDTESGSLVEMTADGRCDRNNRSAIRLIRQPLCGEGDDLEPGASGPGR
jgi:hypothetical protein